MIVKVDQSDPAFQPVTLIVKIESEEELIALKALMYFSVTVPGFVHDHRQSVLHTLVNFSQSKMSDIMAKFASALKLV